MSASRDSTILGVDVGRRRYAITPAQIDHLGMLDPDGDPTDQRGRPLICRDLGGLLGDAAPPAARRQHAITVSLRRRSVALLIDHIDSLDSEGPLAVQPLSPLLSRRLAWPWFLGAVVYRGEPLLLLDLRRIATDVAIGAV
ncbi:chemotaxis protein CheW [Oscillochloris sp. ZM17-4]|uniref:chemotaxis protein CheW n=1 Tax=Oscillochloris sp. ZM17-4 TaxID=2866714 RepID=UPI001C732D3C|nr:chemotaxis protein CheW [Oscillochloris sp. ZM17-4]MBX0326764.1 chemotaxis protein CheW [Oscillochloris sp. ZM17-4]